MKLFIDLGKDHFLCGEKGVFATEKFDRFDIVGEYTGKVVDDTVNGHYVAALEDKTLNESLGIDAENCGNEMRYINSYLNIDFEANVSMRTVYMNTYPHIVIVCTKDIDVGDELLLDYGKVVLIIYIIFFGYFISVINLTCRPIMNIFLFQSPKWIPLRYLCPRFLDVKAIMTIAK